MRPFARKDLMADVVLVEDDGILRAMLTEILEGLGHRVHPVPSAEAVTGALLLQTRASMLLVDVVLPGAWGDQLCRKLNTLRASLGLKVLLISEADEDALAQRASACGADGFATKRGLLLNPRAALAGLCPAQTPDVAVVQHAQDAVRSALSEHLREHVPRRQARIECDLPVQVHVDVHGPDARVIEGRLRNLSLEGAKLFARQELEVEDDVVLRFDLASDALEVQAHVIWTAPAYRTVPASAGFAFVDLEPASHGKIDRYLQEAFGQLFL